MPWGRILRLEGSAVLLTEASDAFLRHLRTARSLSPHTLRAYTLDLAAFLGFAGVRALTTCDRDLVQRYTGNLGSRRLAPASVRRHLVTLRLFFAWCAAEDDGFVDPFYRFRPRISVPPGLPRTLTLEEARRLLGTARDAVRRTHPRLLGPPGGYRVFGRASLESVVVLLSVELLLATGVRVAELTGTRPMDIDLASRVMRVLGKGSRERRVFLTSEALLELLHRFMPHRLTLASPGAPLLLLGPQRPVSPDCLRRLLAATADRAGITRRVTPHMLRHTTATFLLDAGVDIRHVQRLLGHASITTTQRYTHVTDQSLQRVIASARLLERLLPHR